LNKLYLVVRNGNRFPDPTRTEARLPSMALGFGEWNLAKAFMGRSWAILGAKSYLLSHDAHLDVIEGFDLEDIESQLGEYDRANIVWCSSNPEYEGVEAYEVHPWYETIKEVQVALQHDGVQLPQPINANREQVVARLQEQLDEEEKERQVVEAKEREARHGVAQFLTDHDEEVVEYIGRTFGGSWRQVEERLAEMFKDDAYKPAKLKKGRRETDLEKMVRVLGMSSDETIEIQPTSQIFDLL